MKVLSVAEATKRLDSVCTEALGGEVIRLRREDEALLELTPVPCSPRRNPLSVQELAASYMDNEWVEFENRCGKASD